MFLIYFDTEKKLCVSVEKVRQQLVLSYYIVYTMDKNSIEVQE